MDRRDVLTLAGAATLMAATQAGAAENHHHANKYQALATAAAACVSKGQVCLSHCLELLGNGDKEMGSCAQAVNPMLTLATALQDLANQQSKYLPGLAKLAVEACQACEKECRKHEKMHAACKACADSCAELIKRGNAIA